MNHDSKKQRNLGKSSAEQTRKVDLSDMIALKKQFLDLAQQSKAFR
jgi:hypothetical protein